MPKGDKSYCGIFKIFFIGNNNLLRNFIQELLLSLSYNKKLMIRFNPFVPLHRELVVISAIFYPRNEFIDILIVEFIGFADLLVRLALLIDEKRSREIELHDLDLVHLWVVFIGKLV